MNSQQSKAYDLWKTTPPHSCEEDNHNWKRLGQTEDGCTFIKCRECGKEYED